MEYGTAKNQSTSIPGTGYGGLQAGYAGEPTATDARTSQIQSASITLEAKIEDVMNRIETLEKRLYPILRPSAPTPSEANLKNPIQPVPLAETLTGFGIRLGHASVQLNNILERIEL